MVGWEECQPEEAADGAAREVAGEVWGGILVADDPLPDGPLEQEATTAAAEPPLSPLPPLPPRCWYYSFFCATS